ncbi:Cystathionine gamma-lyase [Armadillidium vulgare]|nr:Cystathionine gamma-lyase [Armadillidium vulgare]
MKKHMENGLAVAKFLENHPYVEKVLHPGLPSHPQHELAKKQCYGHSGMITFYIKGNNLEVARNFFKHIKMFTLAESLGGFDSLAELPSLMTHASVSPEERARLNITDGLIRLSCGLEDSDDLINDVDQALKAAFAS